MKKKKQGFTLAEVLIALTIIGVVSALTIPTLVQKTNKQEYVSALQKAYSTLSQAANMIIAENGSPKASDGGWAASADAVYGMFKKYLSSAKDCGGAAGCLGTVQYKNLQKILVTSAYDSWSQLKKIVLADGAIVIFMDDIYNECTGENINNNGSNNICARMWVDINGQKVPNTFGRDLFVFVLKEDGLKPAGCDIDTCTASGSSIGLGCACKVIREGRMDY